MLNVQICYLEKPIQPKKQFELEFWGNMNTPNKYFYIHYLANIQANIFASKKKSVFLQRHTAKEPGDLVPCFITDKWSND